MFPAGAPDVDVLVGPGWNWELSHMAGLSEYLPGHMDHIVGGGRDRVWKWSDGKVISAYIVLRPDGALDEAPLLMWLNAIVVAHSAPDLRPARLLIAEGLKRFGQTPWHALFRKDRSRKPMYNLLLELGFAPDRSDPFAERIEVIWRPS